MLSRAAASAPGRLRLRMTLEHAVAAPDGAGGRTSTWTGVGIVAAELVPVRPEERGVGEGIADLTLHEIILRHRSDVRPGDRFRLGARAFLILAVTDPEEDGRYLICLAEEEARP